jgi:hypothetical protein
MTSHRKRKRAAQRQGLTDAELQLCALLREVLLALRWSQVLGWGNQYLLNQHAQVSAEERDQVMRAAAATVDRDGQLQHWQQRLREIEGKLASIDDAMQRRLPAAAPGFGSDLHDGAAEAADGA